MGGVGAEADELEPGLDVGDVPGDGAFGEYFEQFFEVHFPAIIKFILPALKFHYTPASCTPPPPDLRKDEGKDGKGGR